MKRACTVLLLGPSGILLVEGRPGETMADQLCQALGRRYPDVDWHCRPALLYVSAGMAGIAARRIREAAPDAVALLLGAPAFADDFVVNRIRRLWPAAYDSSVRLSRLLKMAAGGGSEGAPGLRGLIFRLPRRLAVRLIGAEPTIDVETAIACAIETVDVLAGLEDIGVACRLSFPVPFYHHDLPEHLNRVERFNSKVESYCRQRRIPTYDLVTEMAREAIWPTSISDGVHPDRRTQEFDMDLMASKIGAAVEGAGARSGGGIG